jgi:hypothetical protein
MLRRGFALDGGEYADEFVGLLVECAELFDERSNWFTSVHWTGFHVGSETQVLTASANRNVRSSRS